MKKIYLSILAMIMMSVSFSQDLVLTGVVDGTLSGGIPRALEFYATANISDLSVYGIDKITNGAGTSGSPAWNFPAVSATMGDYIYVTKDSISFNTYFGFDADFVSGEINGNGDDAYELYLGTNVLDVYGIQTEDGSGKFWDYLDGWAYRIDATGPDANVMDTFAWTYSGINALDGAATNAAATNPWPLGTYSVTPPSGIRFKTGSASVNEGDGAAVLLDSLVWDAPATGSESIVIEIMAGNTATDGADFKTPTISGLGTFPITVSFVPFVGQTAIPIALDIIEDVISEGTENVTFVISSATGFTIGNDSTLEMTITDNDFPAYNIEVVNTVDATGSPDSLNLQCKLTGVVNSLDRGFNSLEFSMQDATGGITIYTEDAAFQSLTPIVGDELEVIGTIKLFHGIVSLEDIVSITTVNTGMTVSSSVATKATDDNESQLIRINELEIIDPSTWIAAGGSGFTVKALSPAGDTIDIRIDRDYSDLYNSTAPNSAKIDVIGVASQYDTSTPYDEGYQIIPRDLNDIILYATVSMNQQGTVVDEDAGTVTIEFTVANDNGGTYSVDVALTGGTGTAADIDNFATMTAVDVTGGSGSITVNITDDTDIEANETFEFSLQNPSTGLLMGTANKFELTINDNDADGISEINVNDLKIYPNPANEKITVEMISNENQVARISIVSIIGQEVVSNSYLLNQGENAISLDLTNLTKGMYSLNITTENGTYSSNIIVE